MKKVLLLAIIALTLLYCQSESKVTVIKLAHALDPSHSVHKAMVYMAERVKEKSGGKMRVDIYSSGQLGQERDLIELLQIGSLGMTKVSTAPLEAFVPEIQIFGIPYVFRDDQHRWNVLNSEIGKNLLLAGEKYFLRGMCYYDAGSRSFYTKDVPINTPSDLNGLKIRVMKSLTSFEMVKALGGSATPIPWGELYTALQQGVVDGAENNPPSFYLSRHYEVCKYYSLDEHTSIPDILIMSTKVWDRLSPIEQQWLQEAVDESVEYQKKLWKESTDESLSAVEEAGVQILRPDKQPFQDAVQQVHDSYKGTPIYDLIQEIQTIQ
ncbi:TRAP transporter substrate-binding protein [candidate division KSB1 bacterium]|nr:TRAP transporter substrate-binding protein [candidate division KSB1 bacterium]